MKDCCKTENDKQGPGSKRGTRLKQWAPRIFWILLLILVIALALVQIIYY